jgi:hypothetical protein
MSSVINKYNKYFTLYNNYEEDNLIDKSGDYYFNLDLIEFIINWYYVEDEYTAKNLIYEFYKETGVFIGELIKSILKIINIINELIKIYEGNDDNNTILFKLNNCKDKIMKFIVNNQSLYLNF